MINKLSKRVLLTNSAAFLMAKGVIYLTLLHFVFVVSPMHAGIVALSYLIMEVLDLQLGFMIRKSMTRPNTLPELKLVIEETLNQDPDDKGTNH